MTNKIVHINDPVTLVFSFRVIQGREQAFEQWASEITKAASHFEGHLGANWIKPTSYNQDYTVIYKFDSVDHFRVWEQSTVRAKLLEKGLALTTHNKPKKVEELTGLETWFMLPGIATLKPPPKWKIMLTTLLGIYPLIYLVQTFIAPYITEFPLYIKVLIFAAIITPTMTFLVMPNITRILKPWLYPNK